VAAGRNIPEPEEDAPAATASRGRLWHRSRLRDGGGNSNGAALTLCGGTGAVVGAGGRRALAGTALAPEQAARRQRQQQRRRADSSLIYQYTSIHHITPHFVRYSKSTVTRISNSPAFYLAYFNLSIWGKHSLPNLRLRPPQY
jgi:hypothetical protein